MLLDTFFGGLMNMGLGAINNIWAHDQQKDIMGLNYKLNEKAAENADKRTRALYEDFYSPQALLNQYRNAGLSPSLMYGGTPGQGGMSGAQGGGASGQNAMYVPMNMLEGAQIANIMAQTEKTKAETNTIKGTNERGLAEIANILADTGNKQAATKLTELNSEWQGLQNYIAENTKDLKIQEVEEQVDLLHWTAKQMKWQAKRDKLEYKWSQDVYDNDVNPMMENVKNMMADTLLKTAEKELTEEKKNEVRAQINWLVDDIYLRQMHLNNETFMVDYQKDLNVAMKEYYQKMKSIAGEITNETTFNKWMDLGGKILQVGAELGMMYYLKGGRGAANTVVPYKGPRGIDQNGNWIH